jgi:hypothetical protein
MQVDQPGVEAQHIEVLVQQEIIKLKPLVASDILRINGKKLKAPTYKH